MSWHARVFWEGREQLLPVIRGDKYSVAVEVSDGVVEIDRRQVLAYEEVKK